MATSYYIVLKFTFVVVKKEVTKRGGGGGERGEGVHSSLPLDVFSKVFERFILDQLTSYFNNILSEFLSTYRKQLGPLENDRNKVQMS